MRPSELAVNDPQDVESSVFGGSDDEAPLPAWAHEEVYDRSSRDAFRLEFSDAGVRRHRMAGTPTEQDLPVDEWIPWERTLEIFRPDA